LIAVLTTVCFAYCLVNAKGYSNEKVESSKPLFDYILLLGCLLMLTFFGYLQFQYHVFGSRWGLATFIPMVLLFASAYYFDHIGVLSMAITNFAAWVGFTVAPLHIITDNNFKSDRLIYTGILLGCSLIAMSRVTFMRGIKPHFAFTYKNFGVHALFISLCAGLFSDGTVHLLWFIALAAAVVLLFQNARKENSFYFLIVSIVYGYTGLSYSVTSLLSSGSNVLLFYVILLYFIFSGIALIQMLIKYNKILKQK
jgi:hypothetical protein